MVRTLDPVAHAARRDAFVTAAEQLIRTRGYAAVSIADVIDATGASKGAFYHYFGSRADLLDAVVARMVTGTATAVHAIVADSALDAVAKFRAAVHAMPAGQPAHAQLMRALLQVWYAEDNATMREAARSASVASLREPLAQILEQGIAEKAFAVSSAPGTADVLTALMWAMSDAAGRLWLARQDGSISVRGALAVLEAYAEAIERVLGAAPGTFPHDADLIRTWLQ